MPDTKRHFTLLLIEDEGPLRAIIKSKLETEGFTVATARTAQQALDYLREKIKVDGIWLDHYLSNEESGLDFVVKLKKEPRWKNLPVFVVSNTASQETLEAYTNLKVRKRYNKVDYRLDRIVKDIKKTLTDGAS